MNKHEIEILGNYLHALYDERFPVLTPDMAQLWYDDLRNLDYDLVTRAAKRWARHHTLKAPSLDELQESVEWVQDADRAARLPQARGRETPGDALEVLARTTPARSTDDRRYVRAMQVLYAHLSGQLPRWTRAECAAACRSWAEQLRASAPDLAASLVRAGSLFDGFAALRGEPPAPPMTGLSLPTLGEASAPAALAAWDQEEDCLHEHVDSTGRCNDCGQALAQTEEDR